MPYCSWPSTRPVEVFESKSSLFGCRHVFGCFFRPEALSPQWASDTGHATGRSYGQVIRALRQNPWMFFPKAGFQRSLFIYFVCEDVLFVPWLRRDYPRFTGPTYPIHPCSFPQPKQHVISLFTTLLNEQAASLVV